MWPLSLIKYVPSSLRVLINFAKSDRGSLYCPGPKDQKPLDRISTYQVVDLYVSSLQPVILESWKELFSWEKEFSIFLDEFLRQDHNFQDQPWDYFKAGRLLEETNVY